MNAKVAERLVRIPVDGVQIEGLLAVPAKAKGVVLFAHGSGSSRHSPRNNFVARALHAAGLATLLVDLLTPVEDRDYSVRFDIALLVERLRSARDFLATDAEANRLALGLFGASTGAAAALRLAAKLPKDIGAVVSRGGRPDLAEPEYLAGVRAPTLLIVGGNDFEVIELNEGAYEVLSCEKDLAIVPGATHLFEEPGTLEAVARLAADWFARHLGAKA